MKRELRRPKIVLGLLVTLALSLSLVMAALAQPGFTGWVETDFPDTDPTILIFADPGGKDVLVPLHPISGTSSGWDIKDVRLTYDPATHILYVGLNSYETVGDADTDGYEDLITYDSGIDVPNLGIGESVSVFFDLDQDGNWDVIAGVPSSVDFSGFTVKTAVGNTTTQAFFGTTDLTTDHLGTKYWTPGSAPDLEFQILDFDGLPNQGGELSAFTIGAFMGSSVDVTIVEDFLIGSTGSAAINIVKKTNGTDNNSPPGPYIAVGDTVTWTYNVTNPGTEPLSNIVVIDDNGTPGNLADDWSPTYISGDDGDNILQTTEAWLYEKSGTAAAGQYSNTGTATGYYGGFPVSDIDPDNYTGVDVRISISPLTDDNQVNTNHILTITLEKSVVAGVWTPLNGQTVTASLSNSGGATAAFVGPNSGLTNASGQFNVTINSPTAGSTTIWADWAGGTVEGAVISARTTDPDADKDWVDVRISISPLTDDNEVNTNHILTITLEKSVEAGVWTPLNGQTVTASLSNSGGATAAFVGPNSGLTNASGQFNVTINSPTAGSTTIWADWAGGTVEGAVISARTTDPDADKDWVDVRISISPLTGDNQVNTNHILTITLEKSVEAGVWTPLNGQTVTASLSNSGGATAAFVGPNSGLTNASGQFNVTINSPTAGSTTIWADWAGGTVEGAVISARTTDPDANKGWIAAEACIHIEKSTNGYDADSSPGPTITVGGTVSWEYVVTNCGVVPLSNIIVTDDQGVVPVPLDVSPADGYNDGDLNKDNKLDLTETWIYRASGTATAGQYANIGTVRGYYGAVEVPDTDPSHYFGSAPTPAIHIEKYTNGVDADSAPGPNIKIGNTVTWKYIVTNTGGVDLTSIVVTDNKPGVTPAYVSGDNGDSILQTTETWIYKATGKAVAGQYANKGTVVGYYGAVEVTDSDPSHYFGKTAPPPPTPTVGWETYPINKVRVLLPWIALLTAIIVGASLLVLRHRRAQS